MAAKRTRKPARKDDRRERTILAQPGREVLPPPAGGLPASYPAFLENIKSRIRTAQIKASLSVNRELIELYWGIGQEIVQRQREEGGASL
ncbi:MAG TPA: DUF1016 N-terminal domain-containing protein [Candidatus Anammoximicrobium sp.]|nr:DUF1016 N-terminal domain-containing protein [Candidatus Anammoximicrobium sp.]